MTRLCTLLAALAIIARARVSVLPGWVVPLPVLLTAALFFVTVAVVAWTIRYSPRPPRWVSVTQDPAAEAPS